MLTADTKRHIDAARQVLVGKVPDPKQQIDQITNALIYKFMDDMDIESRDAGGQVSFFKGELEQYAWSKLMDPRKGAQERLNLYTEALERFSTAAQLPQLFRDIFRQAFLPYRDPETLNLFLKEIEYFDYNHSEELGNAFEYLLSIMGSQGDAGQFRTPRHIIDFMVDIIDPDYTDTILDPACGTAGFLISAYKHIVAKHDGVDEKGVKNNEKPLTHQQRQQLFNNLQGYDISSDMVKLARVNMYLHGNNQPNIFEYDSLTSEERWSDNFDVILANPPFMTPKGGIIPHSRFAVQSKRAEVLFTDYIVEHLKTNAKAAIIVPESIIFQAGKAYKQLRKMLIENGLIAVISFPPGLFLPYADARTSVLVIDKTGAKKINKILFLNPRHFGVSLTTRKRITQLNDLPACLDAYKQFMGSGDAKDNNLHFAQSKESILSEKDIDLSQEQYRTYSLPENAEIKKLESLILESKKKVGQEGAYPVWSVSNKQGFVLSEEFFGNKVASENIESYKQVPPGYFAYNPARINVGSIAYNNSEMIGAVSPMYVVFTLTSNEVSPAYLLSYLKSDTIKRHILRLSQGTVRQQLRYKDLGKIYLITKHTTLIKDVISSNARIYKLQQEITIEEQKIKDKIAEVWG